MVHPVYFVTFPFATVLPPNMTCLFVRYFQVRQIFFSVSVFNCRNVAFAHVCLCCRVNWKGVRVAVLAEVDSTLTQVCTN